MNADELTKLIDELAARMSGPAQHVWEISVRQQVIMGWITLLGIIVSIVIGSLLMWSAHRSWVRKMTDAEPNRRSREERDEATIEFIPFATGAILVVVALMCLGSSFNTLFTQILNPEWAAIQSLANLVVK